MNECVCGRRRARTRAMRRGAPCPMRALAAGRRSQACGIVFSFTMRPRRTAQARRCGRQRRPAQIRCSGWVVFVDVVRCAREAEESFGHAELQVRCRSWAQHIGRGPLRIVRTVAEGFAVARERGELCGTLDWRVLEDTRFSQRIRAYRVYARASCASFVPERSSFELETMLLWLSDARRLAVGETGYASRAHSLPGGYLVCV